MEQLYLSERLAYYKKEMRRIVFSQTTGEVFNSAVSFYDLLEEMSDDIIKVSSLVLSSEDRDLIKNYSQVFYAPAVQIALILHRQQAAEGEQGLANSVRIEVPVDTTKLQLYGKAHVYASPFRSSIRQLEANPGYHDR